MKIQDLITNVELAIAKMGLSESESKADENGQWVLLKEEMPVYLDAWEDSESSPWNYFVFKQDPTVFQITIPFCYAPTVKRNELIEELLVVNLNLLFGKFSYNPKDNIVALSYRIPGEQFNQEALQVWIDGLAYYAEMAYHVLKDEFHLKRVNVRD